MMRKRRDFASDMSGFFFISNEFILRRLYICRTGISNINRHVVFFSAAAGLYMFMIYRTIDNTSNREKKPCSTECGTRIHLIK